MKKRELTLFALIFFLFGALAHASGEATPVISYSADLLKASAESFQEHLGPTPMETYMVMTVPYAPAGQLREELERILPVRLKNRGEAHITVVTPPEAAALKDFIDMREVDQIALSMQIQSAAYEPVCIGTGEAWLSGKPERTYFIVVNAPNLVDIRRAIGRVFVARGGSPNSFVADRFYPHITLGFTSRDLFEQDGVMKDRSSCMITLSGQ